MKYYIQNEIKLEKQKKLKQKRNNRFISVNIKNSNTL